MEIQTVNINEQQLTPKPPEKSGHPLYILITGILVIASLAGGWFANAQFGSAPIEPIAPVVQNGKNEKSDATETTGIYYISTDISRPDDVKTSIYKTFLDSGKPDQNVITIEDNYISILGDYTESNTYVVYRGEPKLEILNIATGKFELLFDIPIQAQVRKVALSSDKKWLAYSLSTEGQNASSEIWLYNTETKEKKELVKPTKVGIYQGFSIEGWRDSDKELIVSNLGGDAGAVWGDLSVVTVATGEMQLLQVARESQKMNFVRGSLSPSGDLWLYQHCEQPSLPADDSFISGCAEGTELRTYNFATKQVKTVYRNLHYENNVDRAILRTIMSTVWQDDRTVVAALPGAVVLISVDGSAQSQELFSYDRTVPQNFRNSFLFLAHVDQNYLLFTRDEEAYIYDRNSKKTTSANVSSRGEVFARWVF